MNKKWLVFVSALALAGAVTWGTTNIHAQAPSADSEFNSLAAKIAEKFGLKTADVQQVFDDVRKDHQKQKETKFAARLDQDVKDGKLTTAQKELIVTKRAQLQKEREANKDSFKNMTVEERRATMEKHRTEIDAWAKANGIDPKYLYGGPMMGRHHMPFGKMKNQ